MSARTRCSKNYVNCRKHPARTTSHQSRYREDFRATSAAATEELKKARKEYAPLPETATANRKGRVRKTLREAEVQYLATLTDAGFKRFLDNPTWVSLGGALKDQELMEVQATRAKIQEDIRVNIEKEDWYANHPEMNAFKQAVTSLMINEGNWFDPNHSAWGDTRGYPLFNLGEHFKECGVEGVNSFEEQTSWREYDSFNSYDTVGMKAELSCKSGQEYKRTVYLEPDTMRSLLQRLMTS